MELDQWLVVYQAVARSAASKEQSRWLLFAGGLMAQSLLAIVAVLLLFIEPMPLSGLRFFLTIGLVSAGLVSSIGWIGMQKRLQAEVSHLQGLARGIECQFAGAEFFRSLYRLSKGERMCSPAAEWSCNEWLPSVSRIPLLARIAPGSLAVLASWPFVLGWIALLVCVLAV